MVLGLDLPRHGTKAHSNCSAEWYTWGFVFGCVRAESSGFRMEDFGFSVQGLEASRSWRFSFRVDVYLRLFCISSVGIERHW